MKKGLQHYNPKDVNYAGVTNFWNALQQDYLCCGVDSSSDWTEAAKFSQVPDSCFNGDNNIHTEGCFIKFTKFIEGNLVLCGGIGAGLSVIQIVAFIGALTLAKKKSKYISIGSNYPA